MSEPQSPDGYIASIRGHTLDSNEAEFSYFGNLDLSNQVDPSFKIVLSFTKGDSTYSVEDTIGIWDIEMYEPLYLSLCLHALADRDHTVEKLRDVERGTEFVHTVESMMYQTPYSSCFVQLFAKRTRLATGYRILWFFFRRGERGSNTDCFDLLATPEDVRVFARSRREIYERLRVVRSRVANEIEEGNE